MNSIFCVHMAESLQSALLWSGANAPLPVIADRSCSQLSAFDDVSAEEVFKIVTKAPTKHCYLDLVPTWLVKRLLPVVAETLAKICRLQWFDISMLTTLN